MENADKNSMEKIVRSLVGQYGKELYLPENELRFKGLLFDFASDFSRELKTLKIVLAERIPAKLLTCDDKDNDEKSRTLQHCKDTLVDEVGLVEERVLQVLNILAEGLGWSVKLSDVLEEEEEEEEEEDYDGDYDDHGICYGAYCKICGANTDCDFDTPWEAISYLQENCDGPYYGCGCGRNRHVPQVFEEKS